MRVLVLGGTGFLGRHVVAALQARDHAVVIGSRRRGRHPPTFAGKPIERVVARFEDLLAPEAWSPLLDGVDAVVNCVGIMRERGRATFNRVHLVAPAALAVACGYARITRFVHVSALGLRADARSGFIRSKLRGEMVLRDTALRCAIVRPSLLEGPGGYGSRWIRRVARWPIHCVPADAAGRIAVVDVRDVAEAIAVLLDRPSRQRVAAYELGGRSSFTMAEYLGMLRQLDGRRRAVAVKVSPRVARLASHVCDFLHVTPFSFGHLELMRRDNVPRINVLQRLLERAPHGVGSALATPSGWDSIRHPVWPVGNVEL
jgi:NADH dehydrogenase